MKNAFYFIKKTLFVLEITSRTAASESHLLKNFVRNELLQKKFLRI